MFEMSFCGLSRQNDFLKFLFDDINERTKKNKSFSTMPNFPFMKQNPKRFIKGWKTCILKLMMNPNESKGWLTLGTMTTDSWNVQLFMNRKLLNFLGHTEKL